MIYSESMSNTPDMEVDLTQCIGCTFECGTVGYCVKECGAGYIISTLLEEKGYRQANLDHFLYLGKIITGIELYKRQCQKFMENMKRLGYTCTLVHHALQKNYLSTVVIGNGENPIDVAHLFLDLDVIK